MARPLLRKLEVEPGRSFTVGAALLVAFGFLPLPFGSVGTALLFAATIVAIVQIVSGGSRFRIPQGTGFAVFACLAYFGLDALSLTLYPGAPNPWRPAVTSAPFLAFPFLLVAFADAGEKNPIARFVVGARIGAIVAFGLAVAEVLGGVDRPRAGMINPIPFGAMAASFAFLSLIGAAEEGRRARILAAAAFTGGLAASLLSQSRGAWLAVPAFVVILLFYLRAKLGTRAALIGFGAVAAMGVIAMIAAGPAIRERVQQTLVMFEGFELGENDDPNAVSLDQRVLMWVYGVEAFKERPILGQGPERTVPVVQALAAEDGYEILEFTHLHNEFLTEAVSNGVVGLATLLLLLAAPLVIALRGPRDERRADRIAFASIMVAGSVLPGLTELAFGHDILNMIYVSALLALSLSVVRPANGI